VDKRKNSLSQREKKKVKRAKDGEMKGRGGKGVPRPHAGR